MPLFLHSPGARQIPKCLASLPEQRREQQLKFDLQTAGAFLHGGGRLRHTSFRQTYSEQHDRFPVRPHLSPWPTHLGEKRHRPASQSLGPQHCGVLVQGWPGSLQDCAAAVARKTSANRPIRRGRVAVFMMDSASLARRIRYRRRTTQF